MTKIVLKGSIKEVINQLRLLQGNYKYIKDMKG